ncbi:MAG: fasciclin domain-containing protein [Actinobacteria bacterium]|nr:fasciclin domain-containing protein [Actinomycetota bacterium]
MLGLAALAVPALACSSDPADTAPTTTVPPVATTAPPTTAAEVEIGPYDIVGTALQAGVFTQLAGMVVDAGLVDTLRSAGPFTVFAPTNDAFAALPVDALHGVQDDPDVLATVLTYHVVPGELKLADLVDGPLTTVAGIDLEVSHDGDQVLINGSPIVAGDVVATNGVIHVMGDVLLPPS